MKLALTSASGKSNVTQKLLLVILIGIGNPRINEENAHTGVQQEASERYQKLATRIKQYRAIGKEYSRERRNIYMIIEIMGIQYRSRVHR